MLTDVVCLFEKSGLSARIWADNGFNVYCYDKLHTHSHSVKVGKGQMFFIPWEAKDKLQNQLIYNRHKNRTAILLSFPPCDDLAICGAKHFATKLVKNPKYRKQAMSLVYLCWYFGIMLDCPYVIENPKSVISTQWRKPDHKFNPYDYGGYLPTNDVHPLYPEYIKPRDAYPKETWYWTGGGFKMPPKISVPVDLGYSQQYKKLGGKSAKTKAIRNASPRGIMTAIFYANFLTKNSC